MNNIEGNPNKPYEDPSMPSFHFSQTEREAKISQLMAKGMTRVEAEAEVTRIEHDATNAQARAVVKKEMIELGKIEK